jgi:hypothetical protein
MKLYQLLFLVAPPVSLTAVPEGTTGIQAMLTSRLRGTAISARGIWMPKKKETGSS